MVANSTEADPKQARAVRKWRIQLVYKFGAWVLGATARYWPEVRFYRG